MTPKTVVKMPPQAMEDLQPPEGGAEFKSRLPIPSEHTRTLSTAVFDTNLSDLQSSEFSDRKGAPRYKPKFPQKQQWTLAPTVSVVDAHKGTGKRLRATGTICVFEGDGATKRLVELNLDIDDSTPDLVAPEIDEVPFTVAPWELVDGYDDTFPPSMQEYAVDLLTYVAATMHNSQPTIGKEGKILEMGCQMAICMLDEWYLEQGYPQH